MLFIKPGQHVHLEFLNIRNLNGKHDLVGRRAEGNDLFMQAEGSSQRLLKQLHKPFAVSQLFLGGLIQVRAELGEHLHLPVLRQIDTDAS